MMRHKAAIPSTQIYKLYYFYFLCTLYKTYTIGIPGKQQPISETSFLFKNSPEL